MESIGLILAVMTEGNSGKSSRCIPPNLNGMQILLTASSDSHRTSFLQLFLEVEECMRIQVEGLFRFSSKGYPRHANVLGFGKALSSARDGAP